MDIENSPCLSHIKIHSSLMIIGVHFILIKRIKVLCISGTYNETDMDEENVCSRRNQNRRGNEIPLLTCG